MANQGPGLFLDERARVSTARAYCAIRGFLRDEAHQKLGLTWASARPHVVPALRELVRWYWHNRDYDDRTTFADMKPEVERLRLQLRRLQTEIMALPSPVMRALNVRMSERLGRGPVVAEHFAQIHMSLVSLDLACTSLISPKYKKGRDLSVENACSTLWTIWEAATGRPFVRHWVTAKTLPRFKAARGSHEFVGLDALAVQVVLHAVDPEITIRDLRNGLKRVAAARRRQNSP